jgi:hypothetical protein
MRSRRVDGLTRVPAVGNAWLDQNEITIVIGLDVVTEIAVAATVECQR